jgi:hypothetical protein
MTVPTVATFSAAALVAAHTALRDLIDAGSGPGLIRLRTSAGVLLAEVVLTDPCGTVNGTTGRLTLTPVAEVSALLSGTAAYAQITDSAGVVHLAMPVLAGTTAAQGFVVINSLALVQDAPVVLLSATVG